MLRLIGNTTPQLKSIDEFSQFSKLGSGLGKSLQLAVGEVKEKLYFVQ